MAVITKIDELLTEASANNVPIADLVAQLVQRHNDVDLGYPVFTFSMWNHHSLTNFNDTIAWMAQPPTVDFGTAWARMLAYAKGVNASMFFLHALELVRVIQSGNPALTKFSKPAKWMTCYGNITT